MSKQSYTKKPCPLCKKEPSWRRKADGICSDCEQWVADMKRIEKSLSGKSDERKPFITKERDYGFPHIYSRADSKKAREWQNTFWQLQELLSIAAPRTNAANIPVLVKGRDNDWNIVRLFHPVVAAKLGDLYVKLMDMIKDEFDAGVNHGRSFVLQLASGEMSMKDFDETIT